MTLLSMCQQVARETGYSVPTTVIGNNDLIVAKLLASAQTEGRMLADGKISDKYGNVIALHDWTALTKEQTFSTAAGTASYAMATVFSDGDFKRFVNDTWWDRSDNREMQLIGAETWQYYKSGIVGSAGIRTKFRKRGTNLILEPTPSAIHTLAVEYVSKNWCMAAGGASQSAWAADSDVGILDEDIMVLGIKWRFLKSMKAFYAEEKKEYEDTLVSAMGSDGARSTIPLGGSDWHDDNPNIPDTGVGQ